MRRFSNQVMPFPGTLSKHWRSFLTKEWELSYIMEMQMWVQSSLFHKFSFNITKFQCNWFGGEAVSLAINYTHSAQFKAAGYAPFHVDGVEYGEVREYGNFSFVRIYEAGHSVPFSQREFPGSWEVWTHLTWSNSSGCTGFVSACNQWPRYRGGECNRHRYLFD